MTSSLSKDGSGSGAIHGLDRSCRVMLLVGGNSLALDETNGMIALL